MKLLSFKSAKDYVIRPTDSGTTRIMLVEIANKGHVTASHIKVGLACPEESTSTAIIPSANIKIVQQPFASSGLNAAYMSVEIDRLGANEKGLLTVRCDRGATATERNVSLLS